mmetsp:Transcript_78973/g.211978  ORF Transcript_78973/g.211978 Transcript_78973/m.211978 type:complete len:169 (-) Transcript_78973:267-773(-)
MKSKAILRASATWILGLKLVMMALTIVMSKTRGYYLLEQSHPDDTQFIKRELRKEYPLFNELEREPHQDLKESKQQLRSRDANPLSMKTEGAEKDAQKIERQPLTWNKSWWSGSAWVLWIFSTITPTLLIFVLNAMTQGWQCGLIYVALLVPLDVFCFYYDVYAYDTG